MGIEALAQAPNKWKLAERMAGNANAPKQALEGIFTSIINNVEQKTNTKTDSAVREKIWNDVSSERLQILKNTMLETICDVILGGFGDREITEMLEEHTRTNRISNQIYMKRIETSYYSNHEDITNSVSNKAHSMADDLVTEVVNAAKKEGILKLPSA